MVSIANGTSSVLSLPHLNYFILLFCASKCTKYFSNPVSITTSGMTMCDHLAMLSAVDGSQCAYDHWALYCSLYLTDSISLLKRCFLKNRMILGSFVCIPMLQTMSFSYYFPFSNSFLELDDVLY
eukprot:700326_1